MDDREEFSEEETTVKSEPKRGAYEPPRIVDSARFETLAQGCDYAGGCFPTPSG